MIWSRTKTPTTRELLRVDYGFASYRRARWRWVLAIALSVFAAAGIAHYLTLNVQAEAQNMALIQENEAAKAVLARNSLHNEQENATNEELKRQIHEQSIEIKRLQDELAFYRLMKNQ